MKRFIYLNVFIVSLLLLVSVKVSAYDFEVAGICYDVVSWDDMTCEVTFPISFIYTGNIDIPDKVVYNEREFSVVRIGNDAFHRAEVESVSMGNSITVIEKTAFKNCEQLKEVIMGGSVETIGDYAFSNCRQLKELVISNSVISIGRSCFEEAGLEKVVLGKSLENIYSWAFGYNLNLVTIYSLNPQPPRISDDTFHNVVYLNATLYVPQGSVDAYKNADYWKNFKIREIDATGIDNVQTSENVTEVARYAIDGKHLSSPQKGLNIVVMSDGSKRKVMVK